MRGMGKQEAIKHHDAMNLKQSVKTLWPYLMVFKAHIFSNSIKSVLNFF